MFYLIIVLFIAGYAAITLERRLLVDKSATALVTGALIWVCIAFSDDIPHHELVEHLGGIGELLFFLLGTMTIVEIINSHGGFSILSKLFKTTNKVKLLWLFSFSTFFLSAVLGNLSAAIIMITLMWKFVGGNYSRWLFAGMMVIAANAGGAWSPIGDITTTMVWVGERITTGHIVMQMFVPSLMCMLIPLVIISLTMKGEAALPPYTDSIKSLVPTTDRERLIILLSGIGGLLLVPVFRAVTQLPSYIGVMLALAMMWIMTEILHRKQKDFKVRLTLTEILKKINIANIFFLLGILLAVAGLKSAGHLNMLGVFLDEKVHNIYAINILIGALSSVVDHVPLVAGTMGMYDAISHDALISISDPAQAAFMKHFVADGSFWDLLVYCAGTGGSILIFGSTAGIAAMGIAKIDWMWYVKKMSLLALAGYLSGIAAYYLIAG